MYEQEIHNHKFLKQLRRGSILSDTLFHLVLDNVMQEIITKKLFVVYRKLAAINISESAFADVIYAKSENDLQYNIIKKPIKVQKDGRNDAEFNEKIENTKRLYYAMDNTFIRRKDNKTKITVYNTIFKPSRTFGCESCTLTKQQKSKVR